MKFFSVTFYLILICVLYFMTCVYFIMMLQVKFLFVLLCHEVIILCLGIINIF